MPWFERPFAVLRHEYSQAMRFTEDDAAEVMPAAPATPCQLYVHVPFCEVLCPFCSFHRVRYNPGRTGRYFEALRREIQLYHDRGFRFSLYVGGGTPTVDADELIATLELVRSLSPLRAVSFETNPNHLDPGDLRRYRDAGVTRLSVGVQSFDDGLLAGMDRLREVRQQRGDPRNASPQPLTAAELVRMMDRHSIERAVVLPLLSPESSPYLQTSEMRWPRIGHTRTGSSRSAASTPGCLPPIQLGMATWGACRD